MVAWMRSDYQKDIIETSGRNEDKSRKGQDAKLLNSVGHFGIAPRALQGLPLSSSEPFGKEMNA
jgi:hypothetical protein